MGGSALVWIPIIGALILGIAALVKYLRKQVVVQSEVKPVTPISASIVAMPRANAADSHRPSLRRLPESVESVAPRPAASPAATDSSGKELGAIPTMNPASATRAMASGVRAVRFCSRGSMSVKAVA